MTTFTDASFFLQLGFYSAWSDSLPLAAVRPVSCFVDHGGCSDEDNCGSSGPQPLVVVATQVKTIVAQVDLSFADGGGYSDEDDCHSSEPQFQWWWWLFG